MKRKRKINKDKLNWIVLSVFTLIIVIILSILVGKADIEINDLVNNQLSLQRNIFSQLDKYKPLRKWNVDDVHLQAESALSILVDREYKNQKVLFAKNADQKLGIASLTKLMTAFVALKNFGLNKKVRFSQEDVDTVGETGHFKPGETFFLKDLIYSLLGESSNDAASAISHLTDSDKFILEMNMEANTLGLENTFFVDPTGLTEDDGKFNYSTANDLAEFINFLLQDSEKNRDAQLILQAMGTKEFKLFTVNAQFHHKIINSNKLLYADSDVISGKTGWTPLAQGCLVVVSKSPQRDKGYLISVILGSPKRFKEMEELIDWDKSAYYW